MTVAVTGGSGFIGRHVVPVIAESRDVVVCDVETIFHKVGLKGDVKLLSKPYQFYDINVGGTLNVIEACRQTGVDRVVYDSTESVYDTTDDDAPFTEETVPNPSSLYSATKRISEVYLQQTDAVDATIVRYPRVVSPTNSNATTTFYEMMTGGEDIILYGDGTNEFDFVHIDDIVRLHRQLVVKETPDSVLHVATDDEICLIDIVERIADTIGITPSYECVPRDQLAQDLIEDDFLPYVNTLANEKSKRDPG